MQGGGVRDGVIAGCPTREGAGRLRRKPGPATRLPRALLLGALVTVPFFTAGCERILETSLLARVLAWRDADVDDLNRFPARAIENAPPVFDFAPATPERYDPVFAPLTVGEDAIPFDTFLVDRSTTAFVVVRRDTLLHERYFAGHAATDVQTTFSVAKSVLSAAVGVALRGNFLPDADVPVTRYVPELTARDTRFTRLTVRHLLTMTSGIRFERGKTPWGDEARSYYAPDLRAVALSLDMQTEPGTTFFYNLYAPILLGLVLERATGQPLTQLLSDGLWRRIGAESPASWSLDSRQSGFEKMESGFNATARDLARFGRLYLHGGVWQGEAVLPDGWVLESTQVDRVRDPQARYQYMWWVRPQPGLAARYYAEGRFGQFVYVVPDLDLVIVRLGRDDGDVSWISVFERIAAGMRDLDAGGTAPALPDSLLQRALALYTGEAGQVDDARARELLEQSAAAGDALARMWVARCHSTGRMGLARDAARARAIADSVIDEVAHRARAGVLEAMFLMGSAYDEGLGRPVAPDSAALWHGRAARYGHVLAQHNLGNAYRTGRGVPADDALAFDWWLRAAVQGDAVTQLRVAEALAAGRGVVRDTAQARVWYERAAELGNRAARDSLARLR